MGRRLWLMLIWMCLSIFFIESLQIQFLSTIAIASYFILQCLEDILIEIKIKNQGGKDGR